MSWVRSGYCCRCGDCCVGDPFPKGNYPTDLWKRTPERPGACPLLHLHPGDPEGEASCLGHTGYAKTGEEDAYYLSGCNVWPSIPEHIQHLERCTYKFTWVPPPTTDEDEDDESNDRLVGDH